MSSSPPPPRPEVLAASEALRISTSIGALCTGIVLILSLISFYEHRNEVTITRAVHRWRIPLLGTVIFSFTVFCLDGSTVWRSWSEGEGCELFGIFITLCYVMEKQFLNLFLYDKAKVVHEALAMSATREKMLRLLRWALWLTLVVGVPICFYWAAFVALAARVSPEGECVYFAVFPIVPVLFAIADSVLATGMLAIFLVPLWEHQGDLSQSAMGTGNAAFKKMIQRNIRFSLLAIVSGVLGLSLFAMFNWLADGSPQTEHFRIWGLFVISWDNLIGTLSAHTMTPKWLPKALLRRVANSSVGPSSEHKGAPNKDGTTSSPMSSKSNRRKVDDEEPRTFLSNNSVEQSSMLAPAAYMHN